MSRCLQRSIPFLELYLDSVDDKVVSGFLKGYNGKIRDAETNQMI